METPAVKTGSSQTAYPWRATMRTMIANASAALIVLATILSIIKDTYGDALPAEVILWIVGAGAFLTATATAITRIMAIPGVDAFLEKVGLSSTPKNVQTVNAPVEADITVATPTIPTVPYKSIIRYQEEGK